VVIGHYWLATPVPPMGDDWQQRLAQLAAAADNISALRSNCWATEWSNHTSTCHDRCHAVFKRIPLCNI
jgi:hypothetical protein